MQASRARYDTRLGHYLLSALSVQFGGLSRSPQKSKFGSRSSRLKKKKSWSNQSILSFTKWCWESKRSLRPGMAVECFFKKRTLCALTRIFIHSTHHRYSTFLRLGRTMKDPFRQRKATAVINSFVGHEQIFQLTFEWLNEKPIKKVHSKWNFDGYGSIIMHGPLETDCVKFEPWRLLSTRSKNQAWFKEI